jgi:nucleotide sugar dehydrogenase
LRICVVGLGKIGLPLAVQYATKGHRVLGCDLSQEVVAAVNGGVAPHEEPHLAERLEAAVRQGRLVASSDTTAAVVDSEVVVVIVPVAVDECKRPLYTAMDSATSAIARGLQSGTLVIYETTLPVGDTRNRFGRLLESSGLQMGRDFHLAFSPERVYMGSIFEDLGRYPKIVGGIDEASTRAAADFYRAVLDGPVLTVRNAETAEFVKVAETTYRDVNIALANELARYADAGGMDFLEVQAAANTQPYSHLHRPGLGVGGHCIPVYPYFYIDRAPEPVLPVAARRLNDAMAVYGADLLHQALGSLTGRRVLVLGLSFRENVRELSFSSALLLIDALRARGARVFGHDPYFSAEEIRGLGVEPVDPGSAPALDAIAVQAYHDAYKALDFNAFPGCQVVLDGRNMLPPERFGPHGPRCIGIGRGHLPPTIGSASPS